jgi:predicted metal-dependent HD superfamily phosphohydrolase
MSQRVFGTSLGSWRSDWAALDVDNPPETVYVSLVACYAEPHRAYHTMQHLEECFALLTKAPPHHRLAEISLALWFHDAIYDTSRSDNEARSADWLCEVAKQSGVSPEIIVRLRSLVLATQHSAVPTDPDSQLVVDIDLSILGAPKPRFDEYEQQIRREYSWVPEFVYRHKRKKLLQEFANRASLYSTDGFRVHFEQSARHNIRRSLQSLE